MYAPFQHTVIIQAYRMLDTCAMHCNVNFIPKFYCYSFSRFYLSYQFFRCVLSAISNSHSIFMNALNARNSWLTVTFYRKQLVVEFNSHMNNLKLKWSSFCISNAIKRCTNRHLGSMNLRIYPSIKNRNRLKCTPFTLIVMHMCAVCTSISTQVNECQYTIVHSCNHMFLKRIQLDSVIVEF